ASPPARSSAAGPPASPAGSARSRSARSPRRPPTRRTAPRQGRPASWLPPAAPCRAGLGRVDQRFEGGAGRPHRRVAVADRGGGDGAVPQQLALQSELPGLAPPRLRRDPFELLDHAPLVPQGEREAGMRRVVQFDRRIDERATAKPGIAGDAIKIVEDGQDPTARRTGLLHGGPDAFETP